MYVRDTYLCTRDNLQVRHAICTYLARVQIRCSHTMTFCPTVVELEN